MTRNSGRRRIQQRQPIAGQPDDLMVEVTFEVGPVTDAWLQLWRRIFDDIAQDSQDESPVQDDQCEEPS